MRILFSKFSLRAQLVAITVLTILVTIILYVQEEKISYEPRVGSDLREGWCKLRDQYYKNLPETSIVFSLRTESIRRMGETLVSLLRYTPKYLIHEVILVVYATNINTTVDTTILNAQKFVKEANVKITVWHTTKENRFHAQIKGTRIAMASVLTFIDANTEFTPGWLEPLLERVKNNSATVVAPVVNNINLDTNILYTHNSSMLQVGGFTWNLQFQWHFIPEREKKRHNHSAEPVASPTIQTGYFTINREFFLKIKMFDDNFNDYGGENLELSFKTWMCGGRIEIIPCSHVVHIKSPVRRRAENPHGDPFAVFKNSLRICAVWLDEFAIYYYERINFQIKNYGSVEDQKLLRKILKCEPFHWYVQNVYPELYIPVDILKSGRIRNAGSNVMGWPMYCLDSSADASGVVEVEACHDKGGNQYWTLTKQGEIRRDEKCLNFDGIGITTKLCDGHQQFQFWGYDLEKMSVEHINLKKCMSITKKDPVLMMDDCNRTEVLQKWTFN